jgi:hypothetical protein
MKEFIDRDAHIPPSEQLIYTGLSTGPRRGLEVIYDGGVEVGIVEVDVVDTPSCCTRKIKSQLRCNRSEPLIA